MGHRVAGQRRDDLVPADVVLAASARRSAARSPPGAAGMDIQPEHALAAQRALDQGGPQHGRADVERERVIGHRSVSPSGGSVARKSEGGWDVKASVSCCWRPGEPRHALAVALHHLDDAALHVVHLRRRPRCESTGSSVSRNSWRLLALPGPVTLRSASVEPVNGLGVAARDQAIDDAGIGEHPVRERVQHLRRRGIDVDLELASLCGKTVTNSSSRASSSASPRERGAARAASAAAVPHSIGGSCRGRSGCSAPAGRDDRDS